MAIIKQYQRNYQKDSYSVLIDLNSISRISDENTINFYPCRLKAVNQLYYNGHKIIIFTTFEEEKKDIIIPQLKELKYHDIKFGFVDVDFIVSWKSREQVPFFNELFDRDYQIKSIPYLITYDLN
jgi:hypothetical protein